ncbi:SGNH/GDSL hydrolase family protein [Bacillus wiedmannii]|uniref:SGNH/GDSL hydrolase family protein n=1 Tax=Bacillus wiedmannii TaxID=1890302 RepID=UPI0021D25E38|nr:SGNH/GDSL hydrolase family protein [Bacillus wiedmannii]MCU5498814.1 SGNH/GDSL hydrolase family protein [Bacillus wiedmannii]
MALELNKTGNNFDINYVEGENENWLLIESYVNDLSGRITGEGFITPQMLKLPEATSIPSEAFEFNASEKKVTVGRAAFFTIGNSLYNLDPGSATYEVSGDLNVVTGNRNTKALQIKSKNSQFSMYEAIIAYIYKDRVFGKNALHFKQVGKSSLSNFDATVAGTDLLNSTVTFDKVRLPQLTLLTAGMVFVDFKELEMKFANGSFGVIEGNIHSLNTTGKDYIIPIPSDHISKAYMVVTPKSSQGGEVKILPYNTQENLEGMRLVCYLYKGNVFGTNAQFIENASSGSGSKNAKRLSPQEIANNIIRNPLVKAKVKLIGDSITAGVGGTGYALTGGQIGDSEFRMNNKDAICWANFLDKHIVKNYKKDHFVIPHIEFINYTDKSVKPVENRNAPLQWQIALPNKTTVNKAEFEFYGTEFDVLYAQVNTGGIIDVYVDSTKHASIDSFGDYKEGLTFKVKGMSDKKHHIELRETGKKNDQSIGTTFYFQGLKVNKYAEVKNYGIAGHTSNGVFHTMHYLLEDDDDLVILQIGTNDRIIYQSPQMTQAFVKAIIAHCEERNVPVILMAANPSTAKDEESGQRYFHMRDVHDAIATVASELGVPFISNYNGYIERVVNSKETLKELLNDELHPNDKGYKVYFNYIAKELGLSLEMDELEL